VAPVGGGVVVLVGGGVVVLVGGAVGLCVGLAPAGAALPDGAACAATQVAELRINARTESLFAAIENLR